MFHKHCRLLFKDYEISFCEKKSHKTVEQIFYMQNQESNKHIYFSIVLELPLSILELTLLTNFMKLSI